MKSLLLILRHTSEQFNKDIKYKGLVKAFEKNGVCVTHSLLENGKILLVSKDRVITIGNYIEGKIGNKIAANEIVYRSILKYVKDNNLYFDAAYIRMLPATLGYLKMVSGLKKYIKRLIVEIPSYPNIGEIKSDKRISRRLVYPFLIHNGIKVRRYVDLYAVIGDYCENYHGVDAINISNGIDVSLLPQRIPKAKSETHVLALAKMSRWHGYDRLIEGINNYYNSGNSDLFLHMVGDDGDGSLLQWEELTKQYNLEKYVLFHGPLYGDQLDEMFDLCDVAVASLAMHRKGASITSELKIREYCARGIPFVYSATDPDIQENTPFCLKIPLNDTPVDISKVVELAKAYKHSGNDTSMIRAYCEKYMSWDRQVITLMDKIDDIK